MVFLKVNVISNDRMNYEKGGMREIILFSILSEKYILY